MTYIFTPDLGALHEVTDMQSLTMEVFYNLRGSASLVVLATPYSAEIVKPDRVLYHAPLRQAFVVRRVLVDDTEGTITADCYTADELLNQRTVLGTSEITTVEVDVLGMVEDNLRGLTLISVAPPSGLSEAFATQVTGGVMLDRITPILDAVDLGRRVVLDPRARTLTFEIYKGADRSTGSGRVLFSRESGSIKQMTIDNDTSMLANVAYVAGQGEGAERVVEVVGDATGNARREIWVDARDLQQEDGETEIDYRARLAARGVEKLTEAIQRLNIEAEIDAAEYGTVYSLGDTVACRSVAYGVSFVARIKGLRYEQDVNGARTVLILGDPQITALGALKIWLKR